MMLLLAWLPTAMAAETGLSLETVAQLRHDYWGESLIPVWQYVTYNKELENAILTGYAGLDWGEGVDRPADADIYALSYASVEPWGRWTLGRQVEVSALHPQTFDGGKVAWDLNPEMRLEAWGGYARHQDLNDLTEGAGIARTAFLYRRGALLSRTGAQVELGPETSPIARQDFEARLAPGEIQWRPSLVGRLVVAEPLSAEGGPAAMEWAHLELGGHPHAALFTALYTERREAANPESLMGDAILQTLAGGAVSEYGVNTRIYSRRWAVFSGRYALVSYSGADTPQWGHTVDCSYIAGVTPSPARLQPAWSFRSGPGGIYHAFILRAVVDLGDRTRLDPRVAVVPYRLGHDPWDTALDLGVEGDRRVAKWLRVGGALDVASDGTYILDFRGGISLTIEGLR